MKINVNFDFEIDFESAMKDDYINENYKGKTPTFEEVQSAIKRIIYSEFSDPNYYQHVDNFEAKDIEEVEDEIQNI